MRSLWSGVSGLQAHQIAMDVEGNNIANVNTVGFKYGRANFDSMLYQTHQVATAPQGEMGGVNGMQVGLGSNVQSVTQIYKQGSVQTTEKKTDLAIHGDGFFIVSPDGGYSRKYSRNGDFLFDKNGNFVNNAGYIVQGWMRNEDTNEIDNTTPIKNIVIKPGLTIPAKKTENVVLKGVLNSGNNIGEKKIQIYELDEYHEWREKDGNAIKTSEEKHSENDTNDNEFKAQKNREYRLTDRGVDMGVLFNSKGEAYNLRSGQGIWVSYSDAKTKAVTIPTVAGRTLDITINGTQITGTIENINNIASLINQFTQKTGVTANIVNSNQLVLINKNNIGSEANTKNIKLNINAKNTVTELQNLVDGFAMGGANPKTSVSVITAYQYVYTDREASSAHKYDDGVERTFRTTEDLRYAMQTDARLWTNYSGDGDVTNIEKAGAKTGQNLDKNDGVTVTVNSQGQFEIRNPKGDAFNADDGDSVDIITRKAGETIIAGTAIKGGQKLEANMLLNYGDTDIEVTIYDKDGKKHAGVPPAGVPPVVNPVKINKATPGGVGALATPGKNNTAIDIPKNCYAVITGGNLQINQDNVELIAKNNNEHENDRGVFLNITDLTNTKNGIGQNVKFTSVMKTLQGPLNSGQNIRTSQGHYLSAHGTSTQIIDSLGAPHDLKFDFTKIGYTPDGGTEWQVVIQVPEPGQINFSGDGAPINVITGSIKFNSNGSIASYTPSSLTFTANNGSEANQTVNIDFGKFNDFEGLTSYDKKSETGYISQDGYKGGELNGIRIDKTGTIIGSFTNDKSLRLAQVAMAKFVNNEGLMCEGGNLFSASPNSGDAIIGAPGSSGRGIVQSSALEQSNVDLSRSLTQLIIVQRGFQANSKTITTSDQMLNTLLQLKQ